MTQKTPDFSQRDLVRVTAVQMEMRRVDSFDAFMAHIEYFVDNASAYKSDFVVFPELFTLPLLGLSETRLPASGAVEWLTQYTERFTEGLRDFAMDYKINIIGGSHLTLTEAGEIQNVTYVVLRDGTIASQEKIHPTPNEKHHWKVKGGRIVETLETDCGPIGVLVCYDSEFPEMSQRLVEGGAEILFVPFCTDNKQGYQRVRFCSQARAIENQCYVVMSGNVGNITGIANMDMNYAQSCVLTPCDFPFARDGVAGECPPNVEGVTMVDLDLTHLRWARNKGTVQNLKDRRLDLYKTEWVKD